MGNRNFGHEKTRTQFQTTVKTETNAKQKNVLPREMTHVKTMIDPCNDKNYLFWL